MNKYIAYQIFISLYLGLSIYKLYYPNTHETIIKLINILKIINKFVVFSTFFIMISYISMYLIKKQKYTYIKSIDNFTKPIEHFHGECSICLYDYKNNHNILQLNKCKHIFHKECISTWIITNHRNTCPLCRIFI